VRHLRALIVVAIAVGSASWLTADSIPDPIIKFTIPGGHSPDLCTPALGSNECVTVFPDAIDADGFATIDVHNPETNPAAIIMDFFFQTENLDQQFSASSTDFGTVTITRHFACDGEFCPGGGTLEVDYSGVGDDFTQPGSDFLPAIQCVGDGCPTAVGFTPGSSVTVDTTFADPADPDGCCDGLQPNEHGTLSLAPDTPDAPEPGTLVLLFSAASVFGLKRKLWRR
jgi:hypothetical protein